MGQKRSSKSGTRIRFGVVLALLGVILSVLWVDRQLQPLMKEYGLIHANTVCSQAIHLSVEGFLQQQSPDYADLMTVERQGDKITLIEAQSMKINQLQSRIATTVMTRLEQEDIQTMTIPFGSITGSSLLSGRGPMLCVKAGITGTVTTTLSSQFLSAGINQTCHQLLLHLEVKLFVALPRSPQTVTLSSQFLIVETVLPGEVPHLVTNWKGITN